MHLISSYDTFSDAEEFRELLLECETDPDTLPISLLPTLPLIEPEVVLLFPYPSLLPSSTRTFFHVPNFPSCVVQSFPTSFCVGLYCAFASNVIKIPISINIETNNFFIISILFLHFPTHFTAFRVTPFVPSMFGIYTHKKSTELLVYFPIRGVWRNLT